MPIAEIDALIKTMTPKRLTVFQLSLTTVLVAVAILPGQAPLHDAAGRKLFTNHVQPLFEKHCLACHKSEVKQGGLDMSTRDALLLGGGRGPAAIPGDARVSLLYKVLTHRAEPKMPFQAERLSREAIGRLAGARDLAVATRRRGAR